jgi:hypothetical protein
MLFTFLEIFIISIILISGVFIFGVIGSKIHKFMVDHYKTPGAVISIITLLSFIVAIYGTFFNWYFS